MTCPCQHSMSVPGAFPKAVGRLSIDRAALRRELGGDAGAREAMTAEATGRPSANVSVLWGYFTKAVYKSGDLPWLATREALQNAALCGAPHNANYERSLLRERVVAGVRRAQASGKHCDRLRKELDLRPALALLTEGRGLKDVARILKVPRATLRRRLDQAGRWPLGRQAA